MYVIKILKNKQLLPFDFLKKIVELRLTIDIKH